MEICSIGAVYHWWHTTAMKIRVFLVPYDSGHYRKRMGLGPEHLFENGLQTLLSKLEIPFDSEEVLLDSTHPAEISAAFELARKVAEKVRRARTEGEFPIVLSGNCNAAVGTVTGCGTAGTGIVWFDAHGEATTPETTRSGFLDGMPISTLLGRTWQMLAKTVPGFVPIAGKRVFLIDSRAAEPAEIALLNDAGVRRLSTPDQLAASLPAVVEEVDQLYLHLDPDVLDPSVASANQWGSAGGMTAEGLIRGITTTTQFVKAAALGIASYDPVSDSDGRALAVVLDAVAALLSAQEP